MEVLLEDEKGREEVLKEDLGRCVGFWGQSEEGECNNGNVCLGYVRLKILARTKASEEEEKVLQE